MKSKNKIFHIATHLFLLALLFTNVASAQTVDTAGPGTTNETVKVRMSGIVPICYTGSDTAPVDVPCETFDALITAIKKVIDWGVGLVLMFSVVIIAYAGSIYLRSGGNSGKRDKANKMFVSVAKGIFFILAAWLIVNLIMNALVNSNVKNLLQ